MHQSVNQGGRKPGCIQRSINNPGSPDSQFPWAWQGSFGMQRAARRDDGPSRLITSTAPASTTSAARNPNTAYSAQWIAVRRHVWSTGCRIPTGGAISMRINNRGQDGISHTLAGRLHEASEQPLAGLSHLFVYGRNYTTDQLPLNPGCSQPVSWNADFTAWSCDTPAGSTSTRSICRSTHELAPDGRPAESGWSSTASTRSSVRL